MSHVVGTEVCHALLDDIISQKLIHICWLLDAGLLLYFITS
jgi:hypothetical protein